MSQSVNNQTVIAYGLRLVDEAAADGLPLRLTGSAAFAVRLADAGKAEVAERWPIQDLDFVCAREAATVLEAFFSRLGYRNNRGLMIATEGSRWTLASERQPATLDVFFDEMRFCQVLDLRGRIAIDPKTLTLADLLLSKLQYVEPRPRDLEAMVALLAAHELGEGDGDLIDYRRVCGVLASSWRFYHTASLNFQRLRALLVEPASEVLNRLEALEGRSHLWPKTLSWRLRALAGTAIGWYDEVETAEVF
jgi:hypothetical protein